MTLNSNIPCDSLQVMSFIAKRCRDLNIADINATKLQKLMFCCYGVGLAACRYRLCGESPEAWQYGPVFPKTLRYIQRFGIDGLASISCTDVVQTLPAEVRSAIDGTLTYFGRYSSDKLSGWSCLPDSPWSAASDNGNKLYDQIDDALIRSYFEHHVLDLREQAVA